jgi:hypothetical protein
LSDLIYLIDESLIKASLIYEIEQIKYSSGWNSLERAARHEKSQHLHSYRRALKTVAALATNALSFCWLLTKIPGFRKVLMKPEMTLRLCHSINFYVNELTNRQQYVFKVFFFELFAVFNDMIFRLISSLD